MPAQADGERLGHPAKVPTSGLGASDPTDPAAHRRAANPDVGSALGRARAPVDSGFGFVNPTSARYRIADNDSGMGILSG